MISRFLLVWILLSAGAYAWFWLAARRDRKTARRILLRALIAGIVGACLVLPLFLLNHISGI